MPQLNAFAISGLLIALTTLPLFIVLALKARNLSARIYGLHVLSIAIWGIGSFFMGINTDESIATLIWKPTFAGAICIPVFYLHAMRILIKNPHRKLVYFAYIQLLFFIFLLFSNKMHTGYYLLDNSFFFHIGSKYYTILIIIWSFLITKSHFELLNYYKKDLPRHLLIFIAGGLGFIGGFTVFIPGYKIELYPYGNFLIPIHMLAVTYAIFKHRLFEIDLAYKKSFGYSILLASILLLYLGLVLVLEKLLQSLWGYSSTLVSLMTAFIIGLIFIPLHNFIQQRIDKLFLHSSHISILDENELLRREVAQTEKLKAVATLASGLAHEIRNPLTAIQTFGEYLQANKHDDKFLRQLENTLSHETSRINDLIAQLLTFAKPSQPELKLVNARVILEKILTLLDHKLRKNKITLTTHFENHPLPILADSNQLHQAFLNILLNAIDAMPQGGTLTITTQNVKGMFVITFKDTGYGIDVKDLKQIFDPFYSKKSDGTGLGLAITHGIIEQHKGKITVKSKVNVGTEFCIHLPVHDERGPHAAT